MATKIAETNGVVVREPTRVSAGLVVMAVENAMQMVARPYVEHAIRKDTPLGLHCAVVGAVEGVTKNYF